MVFVILAACTGNTNLRVHNTLSKWPSLVLTTATALLDNLSAGLDNQSYHIRQIVPIIDTFLFGLGHGCPQASWSSILPRVQLASRFFFIRYVVIMTCRLF